MLIVLDAIDEFGFLIYFHLNFELITPFIFSQTASNNYKGGGGKMYIRVKCVKIVPQFPFIKISFFFFFYRSMVEKEVIINFVKKEEGRFDVIYVFIHA